MISYTCVSFVVITLAQIKTSLHDAIPLRTRRRLDCQQRSEMIYCSRAISNCISFLSKSGIVVPKWHTEHSTSEHQDLLNWCSYSQVTQLRVVSSCKSHELYEVYIYKYLLITKYIRARYSQLEVPGS